MRLSMLFLEFHQSVCNFVGVNAKIDIRHETFIRNIHNHLASDSFT